MDTTNPTVACRAIQEALSRLNPQRADSRAEWITVGMALHKTLRGDDSGLSLWIDWSKQSAKFTEGECEQKWATFHDEIEEGVNLGTLRRWAKEDESTPPPEPEPEPAPELPTQIEEPYHALKPYELTDVANKIRLGMGLVIQPTSITKPGQSLDSLVLECGKKLGGPAVARWFYQDKAGTDVLCVVRYQGPKGKEYRQFSQHGGAWSACGIEAGCPLYGLLTLRAPGCVVVCEGEKAADAARRLGFVATTSCQGASSPGKTDWSPLFGREVWICPDNDGEGSKYARTVAKVLLSASPGGDVRIVNIPELPAKGDLCDFEKQGRKAQEIIDLAAATVPLTKFDMFGGPVLTMMSNVSPTEVEWLWKNRIPKKCLTMVVGKPGQGKTFVVSGDLAARVSVGADWPDGAPGEAGEVLIISAEDDPSYTIRPRLDAHGADPSKVAMLSMVKSPKSDGTMAERSFNLTDLPALEAALQQLPNCKLVIIDPVGSFLGGKTDGNSDSEVRSVLVPVSALAAKYGVAIVVIMHRRKDGGKDADALAMGSVAFIGVARSSMHVIADQEDPKRRLLLPGKSNLAEPTAGLAFRIQGNPARIVWEKDAVELTANDAMAQEERPASGPKGGEIQEWLEHTLADGAVAVKLLKAECRDAGFQWKTVEAAATRMGLQKYKDAGEKLWVWELKKEGK